MDVVSYSYLNEWEKFAPITPGIREGYVPLRMEEVSFDYSLHANNQWTVYGYLVSGHGQIEKREFYSISFSGVNENGHLLMSSIRDEAFLLTTYK